jgi:hypothetical protein
MEEEMAMAVEGTCNNTAEEEMGMAGEETCNDTAEVEGTCSSMGEIFLWVVAAVETCNNKQEGVIL